MKKSERIQIAKDTLEILVKGYYNNTKGEKIIVKEHQEKAVKGSIHYTPESFVNIFEKAGSLLSNGNRTDTSFQVMDATSLDAAYKLSQLGYKDIVCLNFASAKNPGGGFLNGSQAQEESLARSSGLYPCLTKNMDMYNINRNHKSCIYTDHMIYSPDVPILKDDEGNLVDNPYLISFITSPAVNAGVVKRNEPENICRIEPVMISRIEKVLSVAYVHGHQTLVLGAWGCGVFQNEPLDIAKYFAMHLKEGKFKNAFERVIFAVKSREERFIQPFYNLFT